MILHCEAVVRLPITMKIDRMVALVMVDEGWQFLRSRTRAPTYLPETELRLPTYYPDNF